MPRDVNDLHRAGELDDPEATAAPMPEAFAAYRDRLDALDADDAPPVDLDALDALAGAGGAALPDLEISPDDERAARLAAGKLSAIGPAAIEKMRARADGTEKPIPLPTAWSATANELHGGLWPGAYILVSTTGAGKSQWALQAAYHASVNERIPTLYVGLELDELGAYSRLAALAAVDPKHGRADRLAWRDLYLGKRGALATLDRRPEIAAALAAAPFHVSTGEARGTGAGWEYTEIAKMTRTLRAAYPEHAGPVLVVVDFLQLVTGPRENGRRPELREIIGQAAYAARMVAREQNAAILLVSSSPRSLYHLFQGRGPGGSEKLAEPLGTGDRGRFVGTGKESGETEFAVDALLALGRAPHAHGEPPTPVWLAVAKQRTGPADGGTGWVRYDFNGTTYTELPPHKAEKPATVERSEKPATTAPKPESPPVDHGAAERGRAAVERVYARLVAQGGKVSPELADDAERELRAEIDAVAEFARAKPSEWKRKRTELEAVRGFGSHARRIATLVRTEGAK